MTDDRCTATITYANTVVRCEDPAGHKGVHNSFTAGVTWTRCAEPAA